MTRPYAKGKFLFAGEEKLTIRGITYGPFRPSQEGEFSVETARRDLLDIAANGFNVIRTYSAPPGWFLDLCHENGLLVMVGLAWEQHVAFLDDKKLIRRIREGVRRGVRGCAGHPAVLCYAIGNEIPTSIVRWHGHRRVERFLRDLYNTVKAEDPGALCTYVNYPSTEYLRLPFLDLVCCNLYLESPDDLVEYLARLQNIAGNRPLVLGEIGLDSRRNGEEKQACVLGCQIRTALKAGCAGAFIFSWTDEWHRGGHDIDDWDFGLTRRDREPKPALDVVRRSFAGGAFPEAIEWPRISVAVCSYNGGRTIRDCCEGIAGLRYPDFEVIVVNDGSTDATASIAEEFGFTVISTENCGLASARNTALSAATGKIIAYIDDDARPDSDWLTFLADAFLQSNHVGIGGPNIPPPGDGFTAECVAHAPGGPVHVLVSDTLAEHIPGCNMAFLTAALAAVGGFDPQFRVAGDDVDICWQLQERGWTLGFNPAAMVMHRRRNTIAGYWRQQEGYGKAEALLHRKWPGKYNSAGHLMWAGRLYADGVSHSTGLAHYLMGRWGRIYQGTWGSEPFQSFHEAKPGLLGHLPRIPEWYLVLITLAALMPFGFVWRPLLIAAPLLLLCVSVTLAQAALHAAGALPAAPTASRAEQARRQLLVFVLHLIQPMARLLGRFRYGLAPWRRGVHRGFVMPWRSETLWGEDLPSATDILGSTEDVLRKGGLSVVRGGPYDQWDIEAWAGVHRGVRAYFALEEHGAGKRLARLRTKPVVSYSSLVCGLLLAVVCVGSGLDRSYGVSALFGTAAILFFGLLIWQCGAAGAALLAAFKGNERASLKVTFAAAPSVSERESDSGYSQDNRKIGVSIQISAPVEVLASDRESCEPQSRGARLR